MHTHIHFFLNICKCKLSSFQILLFAFLKVIEEGSHMVMMECPETVNTLLHEFFLWEPDNSKKDAVTMVTASQTTADDATPVQTLAVANSNSSTGTLKVNKPLNK